MGGRRKDGRLDARQERAAALLGRGMRVEEVAREIGARVSTVTGWGEREDFIAKRDEALLGYLHELAPEAIAVIVAQMRDEEEKNAWVRQKAAGLILTYMKNLEAARAGGGEAEDERVEVVFLDAQAPGE